MVNIIYKIIYRYFRKLVYYGYVNYDEVNKILAILFIDDLLHTNDIIQLSQDDIHLMNESIKNIFNSSDFNYILDNDYTITTNTIYFGNGISEPSSDTLTSGSKITYSTNLSVSIPGDQLCIWFACPSGVTPRTVINAQLQGDEFLSSFSTKTLIADHLQFTLYYYTPVRPLGNAVIVTFN